MYLLYSDSISISLFSDFSSPFVHFHNYIEYTISFNNFIFEFIPLGLLYKTFSLFFVIFLFIDRSYSFCSFLSVGSTPLQNSMLLGCSWINLQFDPNVHVLEYLHCVICLISFIFICIFDLEMILLLLPFGYRQFAWLL